jgi:hypothetical protein
MSDIPIYIRRRFEQRWASRFAQPVASNVPKTLQTLPAVRLAEPKDEVDFNLEGSRMKLTSTLRVRARRTFQIQHYANFVSGAQRVPIDVDLGSRRALFLLKG